MFGVVVCLFVCLIDCSCVCSGCYVLCCVALFGLFVLSVFAVSCFLSCVMLCCWLDLFCVVLSWLVLCCLCVVRAVFVRLFLRVYVVACLCDCLRVWLICVGKCCVGALCCHCYVRLFACLSDQLLANLRVCVLVCLCCFVLNCMGLSCLFVCFG